MYRQFRNKLGYGFWIGFSIAVGPGMDICRDINMKEVDLTTWQDNFERLIDNWIEFNPEKCDIAAEDIVNALDEYEKLTMDS